MHRNKEDNTVYVVQKAIKAFKIRVTENSVKEYLLAHPRYPSLKSVCDALKKWKVEHYALNLEPDEIVALERPFNAHLKLSGGQIAFVEKIENNRVFYFITESTVQVEPFEKFAEKLSGAVILLDSAKESGEKDYSRLRQEAFLNKSLLPIGIATILVFILLNLISGSGGLFSVLDLRLLSLVFITVIGFTASLFLVLHELKISVPVADKICGFSSKTDCDTVLSSNASRLFGWLNWADAGLIYFAGTIIYLTGASSTQSLWVLAPISIFALPYPVFSIYYQAFKVKKWCPFCLIVQLVLVAQFILLSPFLKAISITVLDVTHLIVSFLLPAAIWLVLKANFNKSKEFDKEHFSFLGFKRNPEVFKFLLQQNGHVEIPENKDSLILGNPDAPVTVTAFLSLYCNPCADAFKKLKTLLDNSSDVKINAVFSVYNDEETHKIFNYLYYLNTEKGVDSATEFLYNWFSTDKKLRKSLYEKNITDDFSIAKETGEINTKLFEEYKVAGTPTVFVQGYKFPTQFDYSDIEFYIDDIKQLTRENQRQETCANCH